MGYKRVDCSLILFYDCAARSWDLGSPRGAHRGGMIAMCAYSPRSAYISFGRSAGGHDERLVTVSALRGNSSSSAPVKYAKRMSTNGSGRQPTSQRSLNRVCKLQKRD
jgi:hypothetical protein